MKTYIQVKLSKIFKSGTTIQFSGGCFMIALTMSPGYLQIYGKLNLSDAN